MTGCVAHNRAKVVTTGTTVEVTVELLFYLFALLQKGRERGRGGTQQNQLLASTSTST